MHVTSVIIAFFLFATFGFLVHSCNENVKRDFAQRKICVENGGTVITHSTMQHNCVFGKGKNENIQKGN